MVKLYLLVLISFFPCCLFAQEKEEIDFLKENAIDISIDPDDDNFEDLSSLKTILADKRIVGMGESTHGSKEFFKMKHRMLKFLVTEMDYRLFGIEANFTECRDINDCVLNGKGNIKDAIANMYFWTWNTQEVLDMVEWMREYNKSKSDSGKVKFYGFDMQIDWKVTSLVVEMLKQFDSTYFNQHFAKLETLEITGRERYSPKVFTNAEKKVIRALLNDIQEYIFKNRTQFIEMFSSDELAFLEQDVRIIEQCFEMNAQKDGYFTLRDRFMAENIQWILNHEGIDSKIMLWAHNGHISKSTFSAKYESKAMGYHLKEIYGEEYYPIGFDFNKGSFTAIGDNGLSVYSVDAIIKNSTGEVFSRLEKPSFFIDMKNLMNNDIAKKFFTKRIWRRYIGGAFTPKHKYSYYTREPLFNDFDGLIFINKITASQPIVH